MIEIILILAVIVIIYLIIHKIAHSIFIVKIALRIVSIAFAAFFIIIIVSAYFIISDANDFRKNFANSTNLFVLENNDTFLSGVELDMHGDTPYNSLSAAELSNVQNKFDKGSLSNLSDRYYKIFLINIKTFDSLPNYRLSDRNIDLSRNEVKKILLSNNAKQDFAEISASHAQATAAQALAELGDVDDAEIKNYIFSYSISYFFNPKNVDKLLLEIKDGNIRIHKDTAMFKAIRIVPNFLMKNVLKSKTNSSITGNIVINPNLLNSR